MNRKRVEIVLVAVVAVLVVSVAASTLDSTTSASSGGGFGGENGSSLLPQVSRNASAGMGSVSLPRWPMIAVAVIGALLAVWYLLENPRDAVALVIGTAVILGAVFFALIALEDLFGETAGRAGGGLLGGATGSAVQGSSGEAVLDPQSIELLAVLALGIAFVGVVLGVSGSEPDPDEEESPDADEVDMDAIARSAGRAADRIAADAELDNEVYRAWREMTDLLEVPNPESSTPREFADAAIDAGMEPKDVRELTVVFEEVRYGAEEPTGEREERAIAALRRIESTYGNA